ncbi:hypothetical protein [Aeromonas veronii]|nr:hypothetical protein [Aeromonas veronii]WMJ06988.1 hypothetical protein RBH93_10695 [Aeromonas veronii]WMJ06997.1 hypothetical protein RBH93_10740 [Aeromonas veronii]
MNTYAQIIIQYGHYVVVYVVDGRPVSSQFCDDYAEAVSIKTLWGAK